MDRASADGIIIINDLDEELGGYTVRLPRPTAVFTLRRTLRLPVRLDPSSTPIAPGTRAVRGKRTAGGPAVQLAVVERRPVRSGYLRRFGCAHARGAGITLALRDLCSAAIKPRF
jgi:hypothetical protein